MRIPEPDHDPPFIHDPDPRPRTPSPSGFPLTLHEVKWDRGVNWDRAQEIKEEWVQNLRKAAGITEVTLHLHPHLHATRLALEEGLHCLVARPTLHPNSKPRPNATPKPHPSLHLSHYISQD